MKTQHTPGPWKVDFEKHYCGEGTPERRQARAVKAGRRTICAVLCKWREADPQSDADARLIAAAPDLLAALAELVAAEDVTIEQFTETEINRLEAAMKAAQAAIAKAGGRTP